eukprot:3470365-Pyramimonas_sp.AAC.1
MRTEAPKRSTKPPMGTSRASMTSPTRLGPSSSSPTTISAPVLKWTDPVTSEAPRQDLEGAVAELWRLSADIVGHLLLG